jgi:hypothetical protein
MSQLKNKIKKAVKLGVKFKLIPPGNGVGPQSFDTIVVTHGENSKDFENRLDQITAKLNEDCNHLKILKKLKLI